MAEVDISGVTLAAIRGRRDALRENLRHTPSVALTSPRISETLKGADVFLKLECFQHTGTFKARGALSVALRIPETDKPNGITAASAGNHAIAAAWAARTIGTSAKVVMQSTANPYRIALAKAEGAEVVIKDPGAPTFAEAERLVREENRTFIHPFEGLHTSLGTAGVGLELMEDVPDLDAVVVSCGGGGLMSGVSAAVKLINPACKVYGVEPEGADSMNRSFTAGHPVTLETTSTIADSLAPPMALPFGFTLCREYVDELVRVSDEEICAGLVILQEDAKLAVEPAAGAAIAAAFGPLRERVSGQRVGIIICGANIDCSTYQELLARGQRFIARSARD